jgi:hypothetical protein
MIALACLAFTLNGGLVDADTSKFVSADSRGNAPGMATVAEDGCPLEVYLYDWPHVEACAVSWCESRWDAGAIGGGVNYGLFQVWDGHAWRVGGRVGLLLDRAVNVSVAYAIWRAEGWQPWSCKPY